MDKRILFLRISYWAGAILDGFWAVMMLFPEAAGAVMGIEGMESTGGVRYALAVGAALMAGWTALLIWADRKPVERRGVIILTMVPVKLGIDLSTIYLFLYGYVTVGDMVPTWVLAVVLYVLFIGSYVGSASLVRPAGRTG
jgi:hypothetical protein